MSTTIPPDEFFGVDDREGDDGKNQTRCKNCNLHIFPPAMIQSVQNSDGKVVIYRFCSGLCRITYLKENGMVCWQRERIVGGVRGPSNLRSSGRVRVIERRK